MEQAQMIGLQLSRAEKSSNNRASVNCRPVPLLHVLFGFPFNLFPLSIPFFFFFFFFIVIASNSPLFSILLVSCLSLGLTDVISI